MAWHHRRVTTFLLYLVIAAAIGLVVFALSVLIFGRGEQMAALSPRVSPAELPDEQITPEDIRKVRFALALRGYRMSDVDWTLARLGDEIGRLRAELGLDPMPDEDRPVFDVTAVDADTADGDADARTADGDADAHTAADVDAVDATNASEADSVDARVADDRATFAGPPEREYPVR